MKTFLKASSYGGTTWDVIQHDINSAEELKHLDNSLIEKVHAVCMFEDKVVVVKHPQQNVWGLPGGTRENNESLEDTLRREIKEEANCEMVAAIPTSYQEFVDESGIARSYRVQFFCKVRPLGDFISDVAGNIVQNEWVYPEKLENYIENKNYRQEIVKRILKNLEEYRNL